MMDVEKETEEPYRTVLSDIAAVQADLRRLETHVLRLMNHCGISDEMIGMEQNISSQAVGKKRRRKV